jgi:hypothetical protein
MEQQLPEEMSRDRHVTGIDTNGGTSHERPAVRVTVPEAAEMVGVTQRAIRKRVQRGTIPWDKESEGRVYVYVNPSDTNSEAGKDRARNTATGQSYDEGAGSLQRAGRVSAAGAGAQGHTPHVLSAADPGTTRPLRGPRTVREALGGHSQGQRPPEQQEASLRRVWWRKFFGFE